MIKFKNKVLLGVVSIFLLMATSCETTELDLLDSPNTLQPTQADVDLFLNSMQLGFAGFLEQVTEEAAEVTRLKHMFGPTYNNAYGPTTFDGHWTIYSGFLADARAMVPVAEENQLFIHAGMAKILEAYVMVTLVDNFANVPYSEAINPEIDNPNVDDGASIYAAMFTLIDEGIVDLGTPSLASPSNDLFYGGDTAKWIQFANSLKLKMYLTTGLVDSGAQASINALIAADNLISEAGDDMEFAWGTNVLSPDSRHPNFGVNYDNGSSSNDYMSTYLMGAVILDKTAPDPRQRYYFYRQQTANTTDVNEQACITKPRPGHYGPNDAFCNINHPGNSNGYWGRDHGNADGIPPDANLKTTFGLYPVGGQFDSNQAVPVDRDQGAAGAGISPVILSSYVHFMRAAAALELSTNDNARTQMEAGIRASMAKVLSFDSKINLSAVVVADDPETEDEDEEILLGDRVLDDDDKADAIDLYVDEVLTNYDAATDAGKLEIVIKEYYLALFGNGIEAWNNYRRTGYPSDLQPTILASPGDFIRSFIYPSSFVDVNSVVDQKPNFTEKVFWDTSAVTLN